MLTNKCPPGDARSRRGDGNGAPGGPRISVITPCLNGVRYIADAIDSVVSQCHEHTEHIVIDGGSTDGTLDVLRQYPHLKVVSGPDRGIYDALNKGLALARGDIIGVLNSDDCYGEEALSGADHALRDESIMALVGGAVFFRDSGRGEQEVVGRFVPAEADLLMLSTVLSPAFNSWFFRRSVFEKIGGFDTSYQIAGDREFMLRLALSGLPFGTVDWLICRYRVHPDSLTFGQDERAWDQMMREHVLMTDRYLHRPGLSVRARHLIKQVRSRETLGMAVRSARRLELKKLIFYSVAGIRRDPLWVARLGNRAVAALVRRIAFRASGARR
ncbi:MAG TPA: glycosyltransferase family 2 protein [Steroidobacteraceae bacterium]|nr:glycosyltransferase family 2 protein [Steroidobacteraceae bacterium]